MTRIDELLAEIKRVRAEMHAKCAHVSAILYVKSHLMLARCNVALPCL